MKQVSPFWILSALYLLANFSQMGHNGNAVLTQSIVVCVLTLSAWTKWLNLTCQATAVPWWRHQMEAFSALLALCAGNSPVTGYSILTAIDRSVPSSVKERLVVETQSPGVRSSIESYQVQRNDMLNVFAEGVVGIHATDDQFYVQWHWITIESYFKRGLYVTCCECQAICNGICSKLTTSVCCQLILHAPVLYVYETEHVHHFDCKCPST